MWPTPWRPGSKPTATARTSFHSRRRPGSRERDQARPGFKPRNCSSGSARCTPRTTSSTAPGGRGGAVSRGSRRRPLDGRAPHGQRRPGIRRGKKPFATVPDLLATRPGDLVNRNFTATRPTAVALGLTLGRQAPLGGIACGRRDGLSFAGSARFALPSMADLADVSARLYDLGRRRQVVYHGGPEQWTMRTCRLACQARWVAPRGSR